MSARNVVVLAPMPLEMDAIVAAFGLTPAPDLHDAPGRRATGRVGSSNVTAVHIGMGPPLTRAATKRLFDSSSPGHPHVDHVMIAGICGGLDPDLEVGTLINPDVVVEHTTGTTYHHLPPGDAPRSGTLITTEGVHLDVDLSRQFFAAGCVAVDMETSAVAEVCEAHGCPWSVYRCIGDRYFDGLLDERVVALTNQDGSGNLDQLRRLVEREPDVGKKLEQLTHDATMAAQRAAVAAVRGCLALDT